MSPQLGAPTTALRAHEELFAYWAGLRRAGGALPRRADLDPAHIKRILPTVSLTEVLAEPRDYRLRLAGTGLYAVYGGEITGKRLNDVYNAGGAGDYWRRELDQLVAERRPRAGQHNMAWRGSAHVTLLWLRLPMTTNDHDVDLILGYDAVLAPRGEAFSGIRAA